MVEHAALTMTRALSVKMRHLTAADDYSLLRQQQQQGHCHNTHHHLLEDTTEKHNPLT
jgi:hypothetical protein